MFRDSGSVVLGIVFIVVGLSLYLLPSTIGDRRNISRLGALFFVNLFLGWTLLGWFACLIWAATGATKARSAFYASQFGARA